MPLKKSHGSEFEVEFTADDEVLGFHVVPRDRAKNVGLVVDRFGRMPDGSMTPAERHGGIFKQTTILAMPNHILSIVGWGHDEETATDYWWLRNSWGTYWGENGFAKIKMGGQRLQAQGRARQSRPLRGDAPT